MSKFTLLYLASMIILYSSCIPEDPNLTKTGEDMIQSHLAYADASVQLYQDTVYVPIYSDIYSEHRMKSTLLTATLSIRSTSLKDTTYINDIDYYDTNGKLVKSYIDKTLILAPLQSIDYVIDRDDNSGGTGANFIVNWGAKHNTKPMFQAVMIGTTGQHGLSFVTNGVSTKRIK